MRISQSTGAVSTGHVVVLPPPCHVSAGSPLSSYSLHYELLESENSNIRLHCLHPLQTCKRSSRLTP